MSKRYASVDRSKEIRDKRVLNPNFHSPNLVIKVNELGINNFSNIIKQKQLRTLNSKIFKPRKLPLINKQITISHLGDINSKTSDLSTEINHPFSLCPENFEDNNLITESNKDNNNYFNFVINSDFRNTRTINNSILNSGKKIIQPKINIKNKFKEENVKIKYPPILIFTFDFEVSDDANTDYLVLKNKQDKIFNYLKYDINIDNKGYKLAPIFNMPSYNHYSSSIINWRHNTKYAKKIIIVIMILKLIILRFILKNLI